MSEEGKVGEVTKLPVPERQPAPEVELAVVLKSGEAVPVVTLGTLQDAVQLWVAARSKCKVEPPDVAVAFQRDAARWGLLVFLTGTFDAGEVAGVVLPLGEDDDEDAESDETLPEDDDYAGEDEDEAEEEQDAHPRAGRILNLNLQP